MCLHPLLLKLSRQEIRNGWTKGKREEFFVLQELVGFCFHVLFLSVLINSTHLRFVGSQGMFLLQFNIVFFGQYFSGICSFVMQRLVG